MVVHVARRGPRHPVRLQGAVEHRCDPELDALRPQRVVVEGAVDAERVEPVLAAPTPVIGADRPARVTREHRGLESELAHRVLELVDRELRVEHRYQRADRRAVAVRGEQVGERAVRGSAPQSDQLVVGRLQVGEGHRRVEQREVDAHLVEALVEQRGEVRGRTVARVLRRPAPPRRHRAPARTARALVRRKDRGRVGETCVARVPVAHRAPAHLLEVGEHLLVEHGRELDEVPVGVDDRMRQPRPDLGRGTHAAATSGTRSPVQRDSPSVPPVCARPLLMR